MQNKNCSASQAGFVTLSGRWGCPRCGCANDGCDVCRDCGWNRCGCQGGVVWTETRSTRTACSCEAENTRTRDNDCDDCPAGFTTGHRVQCCPDNTRIRRDNNCDCGCNGDAGTYQTRSGKNGCGCSDDAATYQTCSSKCNCGCNGDAATYQTCSSKCNCSCNDDAETYQARSGKNNCGCSDDAVTYQARSGKCNCGCNGDVGIVHAVKQELADVFESESALRTGTLFPELHKPMNGRCPGCSNCSTCDQQSSFAAWDLRLYLNTHPDDKEALALFRRLRGESDEPNYATTFLEDGCGWNWTDGPWPWECQKCGD